MHGHFAAASSASCGATMTESQGPAQLQLWTSEPAMYSAMRAHSQPPGRTAPGSSAQADPASRRLIPMAAALEAKQIARVKYLRALICAVLLTHGSASASDLN